MTNGLPSVQADGTPSSDVVTMLSDVAAAATSLEALSVDTYIVGFALPFGVNPSQLDTIAAAGGTSTAYSATDQATLVDALDQIFADILRRSGAASAVALNSSSLAANNWLYQAKFDIGWAGRLLAYPINPVTGALAATPDLGRVDRPRYDELGHRPQHHHLQADDWRRHPVPLARRPDHADGDRARRLANGGAQHEPGAASPMRAAQHGSIIFAATIASKARARRRNSGRGTRTSATSSTRDLLRR